MASAVREQNRLGVAVREGVKELIAAHDGERESELSWSEVLHDLKGRGLTQPPKPAVGDGALEFWKALEKIWPGTRQQRCWVQKDEDQFFTLYDFPAEHWRHLRTANPIESTFATVRHRTRKTKGCGSRNATHTRRSSSWLERLRNDGGDYTDST